MRIVPFREVLHGVAYKMGLDPDQSNFLTNQAIPIGTYIDEWVRRLYDVKDWPEWVVTHQFTPDENHMVHWDDYADDLFTEGVGDEVGFPTLVQIGRVLKVYLVDPRTTSAPIDTPFTLRDDGIHVGYEHGGEVWIRYMAPPPRYTAVQWRTDTTFQKDDITYSYTTGHVYKSKSNGNIGHDPATTFSRPPVPDVIEPLPQTSAPSVEITQSWMPDTVGLPESAKIMTIGLVNAFVEALSFSIEDASAVQLDIYSDDGLGGVTALGSAAHAIIGGDTFLSVMHDLRDQLIGAAGMATFTVTSDDATLSITLEDNSDFRAGGTASDATNPAAWWSMVDGTRRNFLVSVIHPYVPLGSSTPGQSSIATVTILPAQVMPGATYTVIFTGNDSLKHEAEYTALPNDNEASIVVGLSAAIGTAVSVDSFFIDIHPSVTGTDGILTLNMYVPASVDVQAPPPGSSWWELVPFPKALADQVITGALGDLLNEWGQFDKGVAVQQGVSAESDVSGSDFSPMPSPPLTTQQTLVSRYKI